MRLLVCGSRDITDEILIEKEILKVLPSDKLNTIIHGGARGVDKCAGTVALKHQIDAIVFNPYWETYGKSAGIIRNKRMLEQGKPDKVLAIWDGQSSGTNNMVQISRKAGIPVVVVIVVEGKVLEERIW